ncbi:MAG: DUF3014 domain-containing protein [Woeseiaceae bacterium]|nr:DUF3014 domain-containing protein [Woeseiaceae bacterium]
MDSGEVKILVGLLLVLAAAGAWFYWDTLSEPAPVVVPEPVAEKVDETEPAGPRHPVEVIEPVEPATGKLITLPPLDDSDAYFRLALADVFGSDIEPLLVKEALIDKVVATIDNLPRGHVAEKVRPVGRLEEPFQVLTTEDDGPVYLNPDNYRRYEALVDMIANADLNAVVEMYQRFYPLFQESYVRLGYPDGYFNDRVIQVIDHLLETPQPEEPVRLVRPHVLFEFADEELEALSSGQKLLVRTGADNAAVLMRVLAELRERIK